MRPLLAAAAVWVLAAVPALAQAPAASALTRIGAAAAVQGRVQAQAPGAAVGRVVSSGRPIFLNDHVTTDAAGRLQVLLLDETVFTLGPSSDMVLDQFVYDPATDAGKVAARITKGVFRFVTGKVARRDPSSMTVRLPVGTIGIRGTIAMGETDGKSSTVILLGPGAQTNTDEAAGAIIVDNNGVSRTITAPGNGVTIQAGQAPSRVQDLSAKADELTARLQPPPDLKAQNAGAGARNGSATQQASQDTASGRIAPEEALDQTLSDGDRGQLFSQTAQDSFSVSDVTTWEELSRVAIGNDTYNGTGTLSCPACSQAQTGDLSFILEINFANRTLGGGSSEIRLNPTGDMDLDNTTTSINSIAFGATGPAEITLQAADLSDSSFAGSKFTLKDKGGVIARDAVLDLKYNSGVSATGSATASRTGGQ